MEDEEKGKIDWKVVNRKDWMVKPGDRAVRDGVDYGREGCVSEQSIA